MMNLNDLTCLYDFSDQTIVVTGGAGVLGGQIAGALAHCGANVAVLDANLEPVQALLDRTEAAAGRMVAIQADVLNPDSLRAASEAVIERFGRVDGLVNAAGGNKPQATTGPDQPFFDLPLDALRWVGDLNLVGTILPCQIFGRWLAQQQAGVILNIASIAGLSPLTRTPAYCAAKAGINNFTQWLAVHLAQEYSPHLRVNALAPGFFLTTQNKYLLLDETSGQLTRRGQIILEHTPLGRFGQPEELVGPALWLLSPASSFVTGAVVPVDGGFTAFSGV
jgi:NAD(P)-dependent dehydrogenase (short-subunit alcohol dehydrogenase family)